MSTTPFTNVHGSSSINTEFFLFSASTTAVYQTQAAKVWGFVDFSAMTATETYVVKCYEKVNGGTATPFYTATLIGAQSVLFQLPPFWGVEGYEVSVTKSVGTSRTIGWSLNRETGAELADAVWDEAQAGHTTAGTFGKYLDQQVSTVSGGGGGGWIHAGYGCPLIEVDSSTAVYFTLVDSTGARVTGVAIPADMTPKISIDGAAAATAAGTFSEVDAGDQPGEYVYEPDNTETAISGTQLVIYLSPGDTTAVACSFSFQVVAPGVGVTDDATNSQILDAVQNDIVQSGTLTAGSTTTATLNSALGGGGSNDLANGLRIDFTGGSGAKQSRIISDYNDGTKVCTLRPALGIAVDNTTTYEIRRDATAIPDSGIVSASIASGTLTASKFGSNAIDTSVLSFDVFDLIVTRVWDELQAGHTTAGSFGKFLDSQVSTKATATNLATAQSAITDIQGRLPAALTGGGNMKADALAISGDTTAADNLELQFDGTGLTGATFPMRQDASVSVDTSAIVTDMMTFVHDNSGATPATMQGTLTLMLAFIAGKMAGGNGPTGTLYAQDGVTPVVTGLSIDSTSGTRAAGADIAGAQP